MKTPFGFNLDGQRCWHIGNSLNEISVGGSGLLGILEPQLGLINVPVPQSRRVVQYLECLKSCDNPKCFYHRSLDADELGTASTLLTWRATSGTCMDGLVRSLSHHLAVCRIWPILSTWLKARLPHLKVSALRPSFR